MSKAFYTLDDLRHWSDIAPTLYPPAKLAVIGDPVAHSRSPQMHNPALQACGIDAQYIRVQVPAGHVREAFELFAANGFIGINCTIPHKFEALEAVDTFSGLAYELGAVNTVRIHDGEFTGSNSDGPGFLRSVEEAFGKSVQQLRIAIIGAGGGAGRAVAIQCALELCPELYLINRSVAKFTKMTQDIKAILTGQPSLKVSFKDSVVQLAPTTSEKPASSELEFNRVEVLLNGASKTKLNFVQWDDALLSRLLPEVDLIVNATPIGMKADDPPLFDTSLIRPEHLVYDMVYKPPGHTTALVAAAHAAGAKTCDGLALLLHQGAISFKEWFPDEITPLGVMREGLKNS